jgi:hypothetical protein
MPTPPVKTARKTKKAKKTVKQGVAEKLSHIERALADIRQMVDMNCGEAVLRTARAAGAAAAEEVLTTLAPAATLAVKTPAAAALFNTPPAPLEALPTLAAAAAPLEPGAPLAAGLNAPTAAPARKTKKVKKTAAPATNNANLEAIVAEEEARMARQNAIRKGFVAPSEGNVVSPLTQALLAQDKEFAAEAQAAKKPGPKLWNEFLRNYMAREEAKGRKITRLQAMAEAGPNYRAKFGIAEKKSHKTAKNAAKTLGAVQVAPVESPEVVNVNGDALLNRGAVPVKKGVKILAPGNAVPITPGRLSPPVPLNAPANANAPGILNTLRAALTGAPAAANTGSPVTSPAATAAAAAPPAASPAANAAANRPNTNYYGYENLGTEENGTRKVRIGGEEYMMTNQNRGLFRPVDGSLEWVGYLEPGGKIRATNAPE